MDPRYFRNSITITSHTGVGSSTALKAIRASRPGITRFVSGGAIQRAMASERGMDIGAWSEYCRLHPEEGIDRRVDAMLTAFARQDHVVIESRLIHANSPASFHVLLTCPIEVRAARRAAQEHKTPEVARAEIEARDRNNDACYVGLYGPEVLWKPERFDLVIDTSIHTPEQVVASIDEGHGAWLESHRDELYAEDVVTLPR